MKKILLLVAFVVAFGTAKAQDVIVLRNAEEIEAKVEAITPNQVTYKRWNNLEGPTYTINKTQVFYIKYKNGEKDVITSANSSATPITFSGYANVGAIFDGYGAGPTFDITAGMKIYDYFYAGIATGFHSYLEPCEIFYDDGFSVINYKETLFAAYIPIGVNLKGYLTKNRKVNPYINCTLGGFIGIGEEFAGINGFHCQVGMGIDFKRFTFGAGYNALVKRGTADTGYVKIGYRFGK